MIKALLFALAITCSAVAAAPAQPLTVAVFDFTAKDDAARDLGPKVSALLTALLSAEADLILLERAELDKALGEQEFPAPSRPTLPRGSAVSPAQRF
jgi:hypothetical protein